MPTIHRGLPVPSRRPLGKSGNLRTVEKVLEPLRQVATNVVERSSVRRRGWIVDRLYPMEALWLDI